MVLNKSLRVFLLASLMILVTAAASMAALTEYAVTSVDATHWTSGTKTLNITNNGIYTFANFRDVSIDAVTIAGTVTNAEIVLPTPATNLPSYGTYGKWVFNFGTERTSTTALTMKISKATANSAILLNTLNTQDEAWNLEVPKYVDLTIDAPFRVSDRDLLDDESADKKVEGFAIEAMIKAGGKLTMGQWAEIFTDPDNSNTPNGFYDDEGSSEVNEQPKYARTKTGGSSSAEFTIEASDTAGLADGQLVIQSITAIKGPALTITSTVEDDGPTGNGGILTLDIPATPTIDIEGATILTDGKINVIRPLTLINVDPDVSAATYKNVFAGNEADPATLRKIGSAALTLKQKGLVLDDASRDGTPITAVNVISGKLIFNCDSSVSNPVWTDVENEEGLTLTVSAGGEFEAYPMSIAATSSGLDIKATSTGIVKFHSHAIRYGLNEIYPYEDYITYNNAMRIYLQGVTLNLVDTTSTAIIEGVQAFNTIKGKGTIEVNSPSNGERPDDGVLVLVQNPTTLYTDYTDFEGKINGSHANVGLFSFQDEVPFSRDIFKSATVDLDNLIIYGFSVLEMSGDTMADDDVDYIWLRSERPGADNVSSATANAKMKVGSLQTSNNSVVAIDGIKIDGTRVDNETDKTKIGTISTGFNSDLSLSDVQLYANRGVSKDFAVNYKTGADIDYDKIYALILDGANQPSRITIDGDSVTGNGLEGDVTAKNHQVQMTASSDVKFTTKSYNYYPIAQNNSLLVGVDGKLEITRGATIDGHLTFLGSTSAVTKADWSNSLYYPKDSWFNDLGLPYTLADYMERYDIDNPLNAPGEENYEVIPGPYSTFTTQVGKRNRVTNEEGEYSVKVTGDLTLSKDTDIYPGLVYVRAKPDIDAFDGYEFSTIGQRFKMLGTEDGEYSKDFVTVYNPKFEFRIPSAQADENGVTVEVRNELAILTLLDWSFIRGGEEFGLGAGHNFAIKVPFQVVYRGEVVTVTHEVDRNNLDIYYLDLDGQKHYFFPVARFRTYEDGTEREVDNVLDEDAWTTTTLVSDDITLRAEFDFTDDEQYVRLIGTSYTGNDPVDVSLALVFTDNADEYAELFDDNAYDAYFANNERLQYLDGIIPGYRTYTFIREGVTPPVTGTQWSNAKTEAVDETDFTVGDTATVKFKVENIRKATYAAAAVPVFTDNGYVWNDGTITTDYFMADSNGIETKVNAIDVVLFNGDYLSRLTKSSDVEGDFELTEDGNGVIVSLPVSLLGDTGAAFDAIKGLSLKGVRSDGNGTIVTVPVNFTLHADVSAEDRIEANTLNNTVVVGGDSVKGVYDIPEDVLSGDIHLLGYDLPNWLGFYGNGSTLAYETGDLSNVAPGTYNFEVLAYVGDNALTSQHKLYTFTVNVASLHLDVAPNTQMTIPEEGTVTVSVVYGDEAEVRDWTVTAVDDAPAFATMSGKVTGNGTIELKLATADLAEGTYNYTITVGTLSAEFAVTVSKPQFAIVEIVNSFADDPIEGHTYTAIYQVTGYEGEFEWGFVDNTSSELYTAESGDMFIVEGVAKYSHDDTEDEDIEQTFIVSVTDSVRGAITPEEGDDGYVTFTVEQEDDGILYTTEGLVVTGSSLEEVTDNYRVMFPNGVIADIDNVDMPVWLTPVIDADDNVIGVEFVEPLGNLENGKRATVRITAEDDDGEEYFYGWDVVYSGRDAMVLRLTPEAVTLAAGETETATLEVENAQGELNFESDTEWVTVEVTGVPTVTVAPTADVADGEYPVVITVTDATGKTGTTTLTVTVSSIVNVFRVTPSTTSVTLKVNETETVTLTPANAAGDVSYEASETWVTFDENVATFAPTTAGSYTVTITATDGTSTATADISVTVSDGSETFSLTASQTTLAIVAESSETVTLTPANAAGDVSYEASETWVTFDENVATFAPTTAGSYTVTITATDGTSTATVDISVTVSEKTSTFSVTADPSTFTMSVGQEMPANLETTNASGAVTYTASVEWVTINNETAVATIKPTAAGSYTVTITATDAAGSTATTRLTVTVNNGGGSVGSSGGGCDAGFGALALVLAAPLFLRKRRS